ncbi:flavin reductase family protein [Ottowia sp. VDI28]|uniref:flavin reductase family protein n=1 Tax=Ottowia sp. VDI28 TaxID=3133968 RepID=UPI003C2D4E25
MRVHLTNSGNVVLREAMDADRLDVLIDPQPAQRLERTIAKIGHREDEHYIALAPAVVRFISGLAGDPVWEAAFSKVVSNAALVGDLTAKGHLRVRVNMTTATEEVTIDEFRAAMRSLPGGISIVTTGAGEEVSGIVVSSLTSISAEPPLICFFVNQTSSCYPHLVKSGYFAANVLSEGHSDVMNAFLSQPQGRPRFAVGRWSEGYEGVPVLEDALASMECDTLFTQQIGTHRMIVGKIRKTRCKFAVPLVQFNSHTHRLATAHTSI